MRPLRILSTAHSQRGVAAVEFALIAVVFFMVLLGIAEFGRIMYVWNTTQEVTRRAAREAVVRDFSAAETAAIKREAIFQAGTSGTVSLPAGVEITNATVRLVYLTVDGVWRRGEDVHKLHPIRAGMHRRGRHLRELDPLPTDGRAAGKPGHRPRDQHPRLHGGDARGKPWIHDLTART